jgi:nitrite reductase (NADH) small subunit
MTCRQTLNVVELDLDKHNLVSVGEQNYFVLRTDDGKQMLVSDRCPHRGGPLHLGSWDWGRNGIVCPWHQTCVSIKALIRRAPAAVRIRQHITMVTDVGDDPISRKRCFAQTLLSTWFQLWAVLAPALMSAS